jgi:hypothetical protein
LREGNAPVTIRVFEVPVRLAWAVVVAVIALLLAVGCGENGDGAPASPAGDDRPPPEVTVVTTLPIFADFVRVAGGDRVEVFVMLPDGLDPELLELPPEDVERIGEADLILYNGLDLEMTVEDLLFDHKRRGSQIVAYSKDIESPTREGMLAFAARDNPYLWLDPVLAITYVDTSWDSLVIVDGERARIRPTRTSTRSSFGRFIMRSKKRWRPSRRRTESSSPLTIPFFIWRTDTDWSPFGWQRLSPRTSPALAGLWSGPSS